MGGIPIPGCYMGLCGLLWAYIQGLYIRGLRVVPVLHCVRLALRVVLSWFGNAIDSGTGKPGAVTGCPEGIPPEGDGGAAQARQGVA